MLCTINRDNSGGIETGYRPDGWGSIPGRARDFSPVQRVQTSSGAHAASYPMGTGEYFPGDKAAGS
jgi:hypothetical protein